MTLYSVNSTLFALSARSAGPVLRDTGRAPGLRDGRGGLRRGAAAARAVRADSTGVFNVVRLVALRKGAPFNGAPFNGASI